MDCQHLVAFLKEPLENLEFELIDIIFSKQEEIPTLQVFIDHLDGINLDQCQTATQIINDILDQQDFIAENYILEVSSPGIFRALKEPRHYQRFIGSQIKTHLKQAIEGQDCYQGILESANDSSFQLIQRDKSFTFEYHQVFTTNLEPDL